MDPYYCEEDVSDEDEGAYLFKLVEVDERYIKKDLTKEAKDLDFNNLQRELILSRHRTKKFYLRQISGIIVDGDFYALNTSTYRGENDCQKQIISNEFYNE